LWENCSAQAMNVSTTAFDVILRNNGASTTSGSATVVWIAIQ
jgi:hypothetical protein